MNETATIPLMAIPQLTTEQMREVDRLMTEVYGISLIQMMENAGRNLALLAKRLLAYDIIDRPIVVLAGRGSNGGGGLVAARHLLNWGAWVQIVLTHAVDEYQNEPAQQLATLQAMGAPLAWAEEGWELPPADLLIDAMIGYGLRNAPAGKVRNLIELANSSRASILSLDLPSGVDADTGALFTPHIRATATMTLALPKVGLSTARAVCGELYLADISVPLQLYADLGLDVPPLFVQDTVLRLEQKGDNEWSFSKKRS
ncbi:MAG: NAD(P)H-hydrate epimerase [Caldilineaceae bacterium]